MVLGGGFLLVAIWDTDSRAADTGETTEREGAQLYQRYCAVCHANDGSGVAGVAPAIDDDSYARIDLTMRTGRMPLADEMRGVRGREFSDAEREAVMAYLTGLLDLEPELPDPLSGQIAEGREVYAINCAQCHGASGGGGVAGGGVEIPPVIGLDPVTIAAATREGPFQMPRFGPELISDAELGDIVAFLDEDAHPPATPLGMAELSKFEVIGFATLLAAAMILVTAMIGGARRRPTHAEGTGAQEGPGEREGPGGAARPGGAVEEGSE